MAHLLFDKEGYVHKAHAHRSELHGLRWLADGEERIHHQGLSMAYAKYVELHRNLCGAEVAGKAGSDTNQVVGGGNALEHTNAPHEERGDAMEAEVYVCIEAYEREEVHVEESECYCAGCKRSFAHQGALHEHQNHCLALREVKCPDCGQVFASKCALGGHRSAAHSLKRHRPKEIGNSAGVPTQNTRPKRLVTHTTEAMAMQQANAKAGALIDEALEQEALEHEIGVSRWLQVINELPADLGVNMKSKAAAIARMGAVWQFALPKLQSTGLGRGVSGGLS